MPIWWKSAKNGDSWCKKPQYFILKKGWYLDFTYKIKEIEHKSPPLERDILKITKN